MPIRPRDFDSSPTPRAAGRVSAIDKQARVKQERGMFASATRDKVTRGPRGLRWALAAAAIALLVFALQKPLRNLYSSLVRTQDHTLPYPPAPYSPPPEQKVNPPGRTPELKPEAPPPTSKDLPDAGGSQPDPLRKTPPEKPPEKREPLDGTGPQSPPVRTAPGATPPQNDPSQELRQSLERQQAELEVREKQLADAQKVIDQRLEDAQAVTRAEQAKRDLETIERAKPKEPSAVAHEQPPYLGPSTGTLVWEGPVDGADLIDIQDGSPNRGSVSGTLPGVPVMVQAFPANAVTIAVAPSPSNGWRRIVLRVKAKGVKKVTVRWALP
jgi:hypothetical protein